MWTTLLFLSSLAEGSDCPSTHCIYGGNYCYNYTNSTIGIQKCSQDQICHVTDFTAQNVTCIDYDLLERYPGEWCHNDSQCTSGSCSNYICDGAKANEICKHTYDCNPGYYCDTIKTNTCQQQLNIGDRCTFNEQCVNSASCSSGLCIRNFSLSKGSVIQQQSLITPQIGFNMLCQSGYANIDYDGQLKCATAPMSNSTGPIPCEIDAQCTANDGTPGVCGCAYNYNATSYCNLFVGDPWGQYLIGNYTRTMDYNYECNAAAKFSYGCFASNSTQYDYKQRQFYQLQQAVQLVQEMRYPQTIDPAPCAKEYVLYEYYDAVNAFQNYYQETCSPFFCGIEAPTNSSQCAYYEQNIWKDRIVDTYRVDNCTSFNQYCDFSQDQNLYCQELPVQNYAGGYCNATAQCTSGNCDMKTYTCAGSQLGGSCSSTNDCLGNLYCENQRCVTAKQDGQACTLNHNCQTNSFCDNGICTSKFALPLGHPTYTIEPSSPELDSYGFAVGCQSGFAVKTIQGYYNCTDAPVSSQALQECIPGSTCLDSTGMYYKKCQCGFSAYGTAYCPYFEGDPPLQNYIKMFRGLKESNALCNYYGSQTPGCYIAPNNTEVEQQYFSTQLNWLEYQNGAQLMGVQQCIKNSYMKAYFDTLYYSQNPPVVDGPHNVDPTDSALSLILGVALLLV